MHKDMETGVICGFVPGGRVRATRYTFVGIEDQVDTTHCQLDLQVVLSM